MAEGSAVFYDILIWSSLALGVLPLARIEARRAAARRTAPLPTRGSHPKPSEAAGSAAGRKRAEAARFAGMSVISAFIVITKPHGLAYWLALGAVTVILLWEPATWLTAYLVRKSHGQDA
jgi:hypothetical protein